ncbi:MAG: HEPN domain-containing protein [Thermomicrobiales bacterium]
MDEAKRERVQNWLTNAAIDLESAKVLATGSNHRLFETAVYHCQQAAEKAVKGFLFFHDQRFSKTHDIEALINLAGPIEVGFEKWREATNLLTPYVAVYRYPGSPPSPTRKEFNQALRSATNIYTFVLSLLPPDTHPKK